MHGGDATRREAIGTGDPAIDDLHAAGAGRLFQDLDELLVFDVEGVPALNVRTAVFLPGEGLAVPHQRGGQAEAAEVFIAIEAIRHAQVRRGEIELMVEGIIEAFARAPLEADPELPGWLRVGMEVLPVESEVFEEMLREIRRGPLAHADDTDIRAAHNAHTEVRQLAL